MDTVVSFARRPIVRYVLARIAWMVAILLAVSLATFVLLELAPGSLEHILLGNRNPNPIALASIRSKYHLDEPLLARYWEWLTEAVRGDFGRSIRTGEPVVDLVGAHFLVTLELAGMAWALVVVVGGSLGIIAALRHGKALDRMAVGVSVIGVSAPPFATATVLLYLFVVLLSWLPAYGSGNGADRVVHLILPAIALAFTSTGLMVKTTRAAFARELSQDYVVAALARGISFSYVVRHYVFRNALVPVMTVMGLILGFLIGGAVLVEVAFSIPGLGSLLVDSVGAKDLPAVLGVTVVIASAVLFLNLLVDLLYAAVDPRVRIGAKNA